MCDILLFTSLHRNIDLMTYDMSNTMMSTSIDLPRFCTETAPDFAPLGGSRPDLAVLACAAMRVYEGGMPEDVILPPDVLDTALGTLCAPVVITDRSDARDLEAHLHYSPIPLQQQPFCVAMSLVDLYKSSEVSHQSSLGFIVNIHTMAHEINAALDPSVTHPSGYRTTRIDCQCSAVPIRLRTVDREMHERLCMVSANSCGVSIAVQVDDSVAVLPGDFFRFPSFTSMVLRQSSVESRFTDFRFGAYITSVKLPTSLTEIGEYFLCCAKLQELHLRHTLVQRVGSHFVLSCSYLTSVELPDCLTEIGPYSFVGCCKLKCINLRNTAMQKVDEFFAGGCAMLTSVELPDSVTEIGLGFLRQCRKLQCIDLRNTALQRIDDMFAFDCCALTKVYLPDTVTEVGENFLCCSDTNDDTAVYVPHGGRIDVVSGSPAVKAAEAAN